MKKQHKIKTIKTRKVMLAWLMAAVMSLSVNVVSEAAGFSMGLMVSRTTPISMQENLYLPDFSQAEVKHTAQTSRMLSISETLKQPERLNFSSEEEKKIFYPGDTLYLPLIHNVSGNQYEAKECPSNWAFSVSGLNKQSVSNVRWANENGYLTIAVDFATQLTQSKPLNILFNITIYDKDAPSFRNTVEIEGVFQNVTREALPGTINEIVSPMNLKAGEIYNGEPLTLSFGRNILLKDVVLKKGQTLYLNLDQSFDHQIANQYRSFDIRCYNFTGNEDELAEPAKVCLPAQKNEPYVYEVIDGKLKRLLSDYDEESGLVCFMTKTLGYYVVSPILMQ